jgi:hypothetical protein
MRAGVTDAKGNTYRPAFLGADGSAVPCGPQFPTFIQASDAAKELNAARSAQGLKPYTHVALLVPRAPRIARSQHDGKRPRHNEGHWRLAFLYPLKPAPASVKGTPISESPEASRSDGGGLVTRSRT